MLNLSLLALVTSGALIAGPGAEAPVPAPEADDIVEVATSAGSFETLVTALKAADLVEVLKGDGPYTVFAPTDEAFAALPEGTLESLLADQEKLTEILTYHVVEGRVPASEVVKLDRAKTVNGADVSIAVKDGTVMVNDAAVVRADIEAENGIIHVIDKVILPAS